MLLYHGSNIKVMHPTILPNLRALDFGYGFYLTSSLQQAQKWAKLVHRRRAQGLPIVNIYQFDKAQAVNHLNILHFQAANADWLNFVVRNRKGQNTEMFDLVIGPVANDATLPVIDDYMDGKYTEEEAIRRLLPQNLTDQYAFLNHQALSFLQFIRSEQV
ncbi:DUF3990 domain-containing protein [Wielerella bovis]|uniref:DUF3990 domain-containing protein n=1 Tax=Wielerella bovis TaxID=2917790 RepID=UPI002019DED3|nr:DUF3990 domain-containing protein [Wielerella bovis]ULJ60961.1 DUF3990 domain-containing protein [Wielerella bovis]ULJ63086.1 DUF3990 domain-containing protein [Wielerella bovis]ULJ65316.1 DUF3990 domain-containing protein [Wielerella bovis]ULJ67663.1 DUF3990 domain-containing protein [Wielerella bovis]